MIVRIEEDGSIGGLEYKSPLAQNLASLGERSVGRVSLIEWDQPRQAYTIRFLVGPHKGRALRALDVPAHAMALARPLQPLFFKQYEDAVKTEVAVVEHALRAGETWPMEAARPKGLLDRVRAWIRGL